MKKACLFLLFLCCFQSCQKAVAEEEKNINILLDNWHLAAAEANYENYFQAMANESVFIGTDATENWNKKDFQAYSKPHFDKGKAWNFTTLERKIYFNQDHSVAWFDELLNTQMKICRGSGVVVKENNEWKIKHYVLSMTIPNETTNQVIQLKDSIESELIKKLSK
jgi:hypothetical protein